MEALKGPLEVNLDPTTPGEWKGYQCRIVLDSVGSHGSRLTTMLWKYPLICHAEATRHRAFSRSVSSNRAIPTAKIIKMVLEDPFVPIYWGQNQPGMQAEVQLDMFSRHRAEDQWIKARNQAVDVAWQMFHLGVHKQIANRLLNPWQWVTEIVTATDWANFFALRCHPQAQPEIRKIAEMARDAYETSKPVLKDVGEWHLPLVTPGEIAEHDLATQKKISAARCARTSYRTFEGKISTVEEDVKLYERLVGSVPRHISPCEHAAMYTPYPLTYWGNLKGWRSHRYEIPDHTIW